MRKSLGMVRSVGSIWMAVAVTACAPAQQETETTKPAGQQEPDQQQPGQHGQQQGKAVNRLSKESSPYLRQHQYNPVDWHPWGPEALALAKKLDKPIFLSIGYSACHWCHVMSAESFSDPAIAKLMNELFVCIKVDREERPDIDEIYMGALHAMGQQGGWPLSAWLTPAGKPFYGGTYFPIEDRGQTPGFRRICKSLGNAWKDQRDEVLKGAKSLSEHLEKSLAPTLQPGEPTKALLENVVKQSRERFDPEHGGFAYPPRRAPKFPHSTELQVLMRLPDEEAHKMAIKTMHGMRRGGMHDQIGGGFHRYSTDRQWLVPHFEKMLYDNALLVSCYLEGFRLANEPKFAGVARTTLDYMLRELQAPLGGFWSSQDAQSEGVEGKFFVWQLDEVRKLLGDDTNLVAKTFGISEAGNWEHKNVLWLADETAASSDDDQRRLAAAQAVLFAARETRIKMGTDDKVLASWNGLALTALADGYRVLGEPRYLVAAQQCAAFLLEYLVVDGRVQRSWQGGKARYQGYLEDHVAIAGGLLALFEADGDPAWLAAAQSLLQQTETHFRAKDGAFFFTADDHEELLARTKSVTEGATPSGTALAAMAFLRGGLLLGDEHLYEVGVAAMRACHEVLSKSPVSAPSMMLAVQFHLGAPKEIVIAGDPSDPRTQALLQAAWRRFPQAGVVALLHDGNREQLTKMSSVYRDKLPVDSVPVAYVCERGTCLAPVTDPAALTKALGGKL
ncbi:MAG: hypothetical protein ACI9SE_001479 [Neolewinella sp.]|jgi:uncharacterized protein YyaL (SSP411 family)